MARRHVKREVEERGWDHTKPHTRDGKTIKQFKGAEEVIQAVVMPPLMPVETSSIPHSTGPIAVVEIAVPVVETVHTQIQAQVQEVTSDATPPAMPTIVESIPVVEVAAAPEKLVQPEKKAKKVVEVKKPVKQKGLKIGFKELTAGVPEAGK